MNKLKRNEWIAFFLIMLIFSGGYWLYNYNDKKIVLRNYKTSRGKIINYYRIGVEGVAYLEYEYFVPNKKYRREICPISNKYDFCDRNIERCKNKEFWVIYSRKYPSKSLINLTKEIQGLDNAEFPKTLDNFE
ncbi:MAG: hypothetical protein EHM93_19150 [Bacteroidales bacterium]|nr:MAG: hypothetical protein EHM93_19150 [Bacteroidales bacterium]